MPKRAVNGFTHGDSGYRNYGCRCEPCRAGNAESGRVQRQRRAARLAADPSLAVHGDPNTYHNWGCRCDLCREARRAARARIRPAP